MRKVSILICGAMMGAGATLVATQTRLMSTTSAAAASAEIYRQLNLFGDVFEKVRTDYVEKPAEGKLIESAINGMLSSLDPHSSYMDAKSFKDMQVETRGQFGGLGIEVTQEDGQIKVVTPIDDTPAARAGILTNDLITKIDGEPVQGLALNQAVDKMRGPVNTQVKLTIQRPNRKDPLEVTLTREMISIRSVRSRVEGDIAYIRLTQFIEHSFDDLKAAIEKTTKEIGEDKIKGYVLDLRNNRGGLLDQAVYVSDAFLNRGEIVSTRGRNADETQRFNAKAGDVTKGKPVIVLVNGGSASAAEIVAGALQDHKRATLIGTRSFGKGSVQTIIPLGANGALRLTTARYYTPSGRSIQAKGIEPDIEVLQDIPDELKGKDETKGEAGLKGHLRAANPDKDDKTEEKSGSSAYIPTDPTKDKQLQAALERLRGVQSSGAQKAEKAPVPN
ncbi:S41 family peptidase [Chelatococcus reniformis]|uniref:Peptidase S41 n=1 Tax=Chelatococcus reniformis TaxID=1494448 RepID=A0A916TWD9_9HYPH|nr:S41 family peptidase [Chelatococcus reniformis]GGC45632.1 peptidase S41 [Chelatococcus reniformis]